MCLQAKIEAVIYASEEPVTLPQLASLLGHEVQAELDRLDDRQGELDLSVSGETRVSGAMGLAEPTAAADARGRERRLHEHLRTVLASLVSEYAASGRGIEIREIAGGFRLGTKPEYHDTVRGFVRSLKPPLKLTLQALETLAVVAYKQPITAPEVSEIRGVDSSGVLGSLMGRKLVTTAGRKPVIGRPMLYRTTKDFLLRFGLKDVSELPSIEEFEKLAGEFQEGSQREMPMRVEDEQVAVDEERKAVSPQGDGDSTALDQTKTVDGRISGVPPTDDNTEADPSAREAEIQSSE